MARTEGVGVCPHKLPTTKTTECVSNPLACASSIGAVGRSFDRIQNPQVFVFQRFKIILKPFVPRVEDADLKSQSGRSDEEVREGDSTGDEHSVRSRGGTSLICLREG